uniref:proline-, glutamic acid- and leucine-rich protein 1 n=1 Tax=Erigeron canadensis TaxID=72917 RepID=UPI001CB99F32|nr:proline-, glutamic acid- and leucine-rich protein 1 [Erigeron canadensis]
MAAFEFVENLNDVALKPRLLVSLIREHIPDEKQQLRNSLVLSRVVSEIKTHELLSERVPQSAADNNKFIEKWKSAVDLWIDRVLMLVSSNMPDKCWAGICLLGLTCEECSSERFLASYSVWFQKLLSHLQPLAESHFVKIACCVSLSDLLTRLGGFPNMKRDGASSAAKLFQPVLKLMNEDSSDAEGAVNLLCTILNLFPSSLQKNYDSAEAAIVTKLMSGKCNTIMLKKLALCLSLLPKSRGDEDSWFLMMQKVLLAINVLLNDSFQGLEEETATRETMRALVFSGKDPPTPLGGLTIFDISNKETMPERLAIPSVSALMLCCYTMLTTYYPVQVKAPVKPLLMLAGRVLMVDGSMPPTLYPSITAMHQEYICSELPLLHAHSLDILSGIIKKACSQLLPHTAQIIRIVMEYLGRCELPGLRVKLYALIKLMLMSMGVGMTIFIAEDVVRSASADLDLRVGAEAGSSLVVKTSDALPKSIQKKRKYEMSLTPPKVQSPTICSRSNPVSVKIAALEVLEMLLTVGGSLKTDRWRSDIDLLLVNVATDACKGGWTKPTTDFNNPHNSNSSWADFQLASLRALLASLLSPGLIRAPSLAQGLELFRKGKQEAGTKVAEFCAHALLALELLIHPRALPLIDFGSSIEYPVNGNKSRFMENITNSGPQQHNNNMFRNKPDTPESEEDDLYNKWVRENDDNEPPVTLPEKNTFTNETAQQSVEKIVSIDGPSGTEPSEDKGKGILVETRSAEIFNKNSEILSQKVDIYEPDDMGTSDLETKGKAPVSGSNVAMDVMFSLGDNDDSMDDFPDIVDIEPDSDED